MKEYSFPKFSCSVNCSLTERAGSTLKKYHHHQVALLILSHAIRSYNPSLPAGLLNYILYQYRSVVVIYKGFSLDMAQEHMNGAPYETRTHS